MTARNLPRQCLVDTGVLIRALRQNSDVYAKSCRAFWDSMIDAKNQILIAAPTLAEVLRGNPKTKIPSTRSIRVIPFDRKAAELLGHKLPVTVTKTAAKKSGLSHTYFKYDAMIVACAKRWGGRDDRRTR